MHARETGSRNVTTYDCFFTLLLGGSLAAAQMREAKEQAVWQQHSAPMVFPGR